MVELPAVDVHMCVGIAQPTKHTPNKAETGASQVQIPPARPRFSFERQFTTNRVALVSTLKGLVPLQFDVDRPLQHF